MTAALQDLQQRVRELEAALHPFAAYAAALDAYGKLHHGRSLPDDKNMAYVQTEMGHTGSITWSDFRFARELMPKARHGGESTAMRRRALISQHTEKTDG